MQRIARGVLVTHVNRRIADKRSHDCRRNPLAAGAVFGCLRALQILHFKLAQSFRFTRGAFYLCHRTPPTLNTTMTPTTHNPATRYTRSRSS